MHANTTTTSAITSTTTTDNDDDNNILATVGQQKSYAQLNGQIMVYFIYLFIFTVEKCQ